MRRAGLLARCGSYTVNILVGVDVLACAVLGGPRYFTISGTIGHSIRTGGWASRIPWPAWWVRHCLASDFRTEV